MSWIFSLIGNLNEDTLDRVRKIIPENSDFYQIKNNIFLASSKLNKTSFSGSFTKTDILHHWSAVGQGIEKDENSYKFLDEKGWEKFLSSGNPNPSNFNGHFVCALINEKIAVFFNDCLGIRDFHLAKMDDLYILSTRLDFITKFTGFNEIDFNVFGSGWLLENRISTDSVIKNIRRFTANSRVEFNLNESIHTINISDKKWSPDFKENITDSGISEKLTLLSTFPLDARKKISLGLSGGLDSRVLFSLLKDLENFHTFTFGPKNHPDSVIAQKLAGIYDIPHQIFDEKPHFNDSTIGKLYKFSASNQATSPLSEYFQKIYYEDSFDSDEIIIDGGFGEILRRGLFNKLQYFWSRKLKESASLTADDAKTFYKFLRIKRADFFSEEINQQMEKSSFLQIEQLFDEMPEIHSFGIENWLDLLSVRTKLINYCSIEQARIDEYCMSYNPFSQPELLNDSFSLDLKYKKNAKLFNEIIKKRALEITNIQLVKGNITIPFFRNTLVQKSIAKVKSKIGIGFQDTSSNIFLDTYKEWILDLVSSDNVLKNTFYNSEKIEKTVRDFYSGNTDSAKELDWWLSFHLFCTSL